MANVARIRCTRTHPHSEGAILFAALLRILRHLPLVWRTRFRGSQSSRNQLSLGG
jgi:hypothetical protein